MGEQKRPLALIILFGALTLFCVIGFATDPRSEVASEEGAGIDRVITYLLWATGVIIVIGNIVLCTFLWKSGSQKEYGRPSRRAEWLWGLIPVLIMSILSEAGVLIVGAPVWNSMYVDEPDNALVIEVVGKQFEWFVRYPGKDGVFGRIDWEQVHGVDNPIGLDENDPAAQDDVVKRGDVFVPNKRPIIVRLRTHDVIHSFFVPEFRVKQDVLPGLTTRLKFTPTRTGKFELACAELCGLGHYNMRGTCTVLEPASVLMQWLSKQFTFGG